MCNNAPFTSPRIVYMHIQMKRLYSAALELKGIATQADLARAFNTSSQALKNWEYRGISDGGRLQAQRVIGCSAQWLETGEGDMALNHVPPEPGNLSRTARPSVAFDDDDPLDDDMVSVPSLALKLSAGSGRLEWEVDHTGKPNRYRKDWISRRGLNPSKLVKVKVTGDSMEPGIPDGASLTLDTANTALRTGKRHAIDYLGEFFIKRLFRQPDGSVLVRSDNPDKERHPDWTITHEHGEAIRIMGSIVEISIDTDD